MRTQLARARTLKEFHPSCKVTMVLTSRLDYVPGGSRLSKRLCSMHPARRNVRAILKGVESNAADYEHALALFEAVTSDGSLVTEDVLTKLKKLLDANCILDLIDLPQGAKSGTSIFRRCFSA